MKNFKSSTFIAIVLIMAVFVGVAYYMNSGQKAKTLPVYGFDQEKMKPHTVADFSLVNQDGVVITQKEIANHIYVANFFFAQCKGICPSMNHQLSRVYAQYKNSPDVLFLSHSVKPQEDSVPALHEYAKLYEADPKHWWFLTGDKKKIYDLARTSYLASISQGDGGAEDFVHTQLLTLIDKNRQIRGIYDGLDSTQVNQLITDINILLQE